MVILMVKLELLGDPSRQKQSNNQTAAMVAHSGISSDFIYFNALWLLHMYVKMFTASATIKSLITRYLYALHFPLILVTLSLPLEYHTNWYHITPPPPKK